MSRHAVAAELQRIIEEGQRVCRDGARLADSSGGMVDPKWFRGAHTALTMAMGDLDQKGLVVPNPAPASETAG